MMLRAGEVSVSGEEFLAGISIHRAWAGWQPTVWSSEGITVANTSTEDILMDYCHLGDRFLRTNEFYALKLTAKSGGNDRRICGLYDLSRRQPPRLAAISSGHG
jgi:hypothetical protein